MVRVLLPLALVAVFLATGCGDGTKVGDNPNSADARTAATDPDLANKKAARDAARSENTRVPPFKRR